MLARLAWIVLTGCAAAHPDGALDAGMDDAASSIADSGPTDDAVPAQDAASPFDAGPALGVAITANCNPTDGGSFVLSLQPGGPACDAPLASSALVMEVRDRLWPTNPPGRVYQLGGAAPSDGTARYCLDGRDAATCIALVGTLTIDAITTGPLYFHYELTGADGVHAGMQPDPYLWCPGTDTCPAPGI